MRSPFLFDPPATAVHTAFAVRIGPSLPIEYATRNHDEACRAADWWMLRPAPWRPPCLPDDSVMPGTARWANADRVSFGVEFRSFNCLAGNFGIVLCDVVSGFAILKPSQNRIHRNSRSGDHGRTREDIRIRRDVPISVLPVLFGLTHHSTLRRFGNLGVINELGVSRRQRPRSASDSDRGTPLRAQ